MSITTTLVQTWGSPQSNDFHCDMLLMLQALLPFIQATKLLQLLLLRLDSAGLKSTDTGFIVLTQNANLKMFIVPGFTQDKRA
jgi:hypothetical protein